jgi:hypothetical protein
MILVILMAFAVGCPATGPELASVEGRVTVKGKPLPNLEVVFVPELGTAGRDFSAYTDADGKYRVLADAKKKVGVPVGTHRVLIRDADMYLVLPSSNIDAESGEVKDASAKAPPPKVSRVPVDYGASDKTPLRNVTIQPGMQTYDFDVK